MSLFELQTTISTAIFAADPRNVAFIPNTTKMMTTESGSTAVRKIDYSTSPVTVDTTYTVAAAASVIAVIENGASAVHASSANSSWYALDLTTGAQSTFTGGTAPQQHITGSMQQAVYDDLNYAYFTCTTANTINRFNWNTWTVSTVGVDGLTDGAGTTQIIKTLVKMPGGNMIVGTSRGSLVEYDPSTLLVQGRLDLPWYDTVPTNLNNDLVLPSLAVFGITFPNGTDDIAHVYTANGYFYIIDWATKTVLHREIRQGNVSQACTAASGMSFYAANVHTDTGILYATDTSHHPPKMVDWYFINGSGYIYECAMYGSKLIVLNENTSGSIRGAVFTLMASGMPAVSDINTVLIDGGGQTGRVIRIQDGTVGTATVISDSPVEASGSAMKVPTDTSIIEFAVYGTGTNEKAALSVYET